MDHKNSTSSFTDLYQDLISIFKELEDRINNLSNKLRNTTGSITNPDVEEMNKLKKQRLEVRVLADKLEKEPNDSNISKEAVLEVIRESRNLLKTIL